MTVLHRALGDSFTDLHPMIQRRFGLNPDGGEASIGTGVMTRVWHAPFTLPFLHVGATRHIMFPEQRQNVPFTIENYAFVDDLGRDTLSLVRTFTLPRPRRFDAYMVWSEARGRVVDYLGSHQHLAVDISATVSERGGLTLRSGAQRFYEGPLGFDFPMVLSGYADVEEWFDDHAGVFRIRIGVTNPVFGPLFGYEGAFTAQWRTVPPRYLPDHLRPVRTERRE